MTFAPTRSELAQVLPGRWRVRASNLVRWISGERTDPVIEIELRGASGDAHSDASNIALTVREKFESPVGRSRSITRTAVGTPDGFASPGAGLRRLSRTHWSVPWLSDDGVVAVVVHDLGGNHGDGIEVLVRDDESARDVRSTVTSAWEEFGLKPEDLAKLSWFSI